MKNEISISKSLETAVKVLNEQRKAEGKKNLPAHLFTEYHLATLKGEPVKVGDYCSFYSVYLGEELAGMYAVVLVPCTYGRWAIEEQDCHTSMCHINRQGYIEVCVSNDAKIKEYHWLIVPTYAAVRTDTKEDMLNRYDNIIKASNI